MRIRVHIFIPLTILLASCNSVETVGTVAPYPVSSPDRATDAYPVGVTASPVPSPSGTVSPFRLQKPLLEGADSVSGTGPANVPIILVDVTFMGAAMGQTVIDASGKFVVQVPALEEGHRIGLALGDLTGTPWTPADYSFAAFNGDEPVSVPAVGFFFDTAMVQPK